MSSAVIGAVILVLVGVPAFLIVKMKFAEEKQRQAKLRSPRKLRLSAAEVASEEAEAAKRDQARHPRFGRRAFKSPESARKIFSWL